MHLLGAADSAVMRAAVSEDRVIVTHDGDFGRLAIATGEPFVGIVLLRPGHLNAVFTIRALERLFAADLDLAAPFTIVVHRRGGHRNRPPPCRIAKSVYGASPMGRARLPEESVCSEHARA